MSSSSSTTTIKRKTNKPKRGSNRRNKGNNNNRNNLIKSYDHAGLVPSMHTMENRVYTLVQNIDTNYTLSQAALTESTLAFKFQLNDLADYTSFQVIFDQYKIDKVQVQIRPIGRAQPIVGINTEKIPLLFTVIDYDDATAPTGTSQLKEYSNCNVSLYETVVATFAPHMALAAYSGAFSSFANVGPTWIDIANPSVQHYGLKLACEAGLSGQTLLQYWDIQFKYQVSFRNVR